MIHAAAGKVDAEAEALSWMRRRYKAALELASSAGSADLFYPRMNLLAAELASPTTERPRIPAAELAEIRELLADRGVVAGLLERGGSDRTEDVRSGRGRSRLPRHASRCGRNSASTTSG